MSERKIAPAWLLAAAEAEAGMCISAGTGRGDYDPEKLRAETLRKFAPADLAIVKGLVERYSKLEVMDVVTSFK